MLSTPHGELETFSLTASGMKEFVALSTPHGELETEWQFQWLEEVKTFNSTR